ncbi:unnamed protein product [Caretta caretta]
MFNFSKDTRNDYVCQEIADKLATLGIHWIDEQCREWIKELKGNYWKARDENCTSENSLPSCLLYQDFDQVLGTVPSTKPSAVHDSLVSQDSNLLTPKSRTGEEPRGIGSG